MGLQCETAIARPAPAVHKIADLTVRLAENGNGGYTRIEEALANLGHRVSRTTVANILRRHGIDPAPEPSRSPNLNGVMERWIRTLKDLDGTITADPSKICDHD